MYIHIIHDTYTYIYIHIVYMYNIIQYDIHTRTQSYTFDFFNTFSEFGSVADVSVNAQVTPDKDAPGPASLALLLIPSDVQKSPKIWETERFS